MDVKNLDSKSNLDSSRSGIIFEVFTLFPEVFYPYLQSSILQRAHKSGMLKVRLHNIRDWAADRHHTTDDVPYGGGGGMVMKPEPVFAAVESVYGGTPASPIILLTPQGRLFTQKTAEKLIQGATNPEVDVRIQDAIRIGLICGRYEGIDERIRVHLASDEISIGDYVLTGGELAALVVIDAVTRLLPGVLGDPQAASEDSFAAGLLEYPHYTRPAEFRDWKVPEVLLSGDHARIQKWRRQQALLRTQSRRPELLDTADLSEEDLQLLSQSNFHSQTE